MQRLARVIGLSRSMAPVLLGNRIDALTAVEIGLACECVPDAELLIAAGQLAQKIAAQDSLAVRANIGLLRATREIPLSEGLDRETVAVAELLVRRDTAVDKAERPDE